MSHNISVERVAVLARINKVLNTDEKAVYTGEMEAILKYVDELQNVDLKDIPTVITDITTSIDDLREDEQNANEKYEEVRKNIINNFPNKNNNLLVLPGIFEE